VFEKRKEKKCAGGNETSDEEGQQESNDMWLQRS